MILAAGNPRLASLFIPKIVPTVQPSDVIVMYEKCGLRLKAVEEAIRIKDTESLQRLKDAAGIDSIEAREIVRLEAGLKK